MKSTITKANEFIQIGSIYAKENDNKLSYAIKKTIKRIRDANDELNEKLEDLRIEYCSVDEKGDITRDEKGLYKFTKENLKKLNVEVKKLQLEFEPYYASEVPELTDEQREQFEFVIKKEK